MCGINGILSLGNFTDCEATIGAMNENLSHRGPDASGVWSDSKVGVYLGHTRLSIQDLSESANQPFASKSNRYILTFNGEIYNFEILRSELKAKGYTFSTHSDTEVLANLIDCYGIDNALTAIEGMFAFAVWDKEEKELCLVRDRMGEKPLYIFRKDNFFAFSSELKALPCEDDLELDDEALKEFIEYGYLAPDKSPFLSVKKLKPACILKIKNRGNKLVYEERTFWTSSVSRASINKNKSDDIIIDEFDSLLRDTVEKEMIADVGVGVFLSGGIDSSLVASVMTDLSEKPINTFTVAFGEAEFDESSYARAIAEDLGTNHHEIHLSPEECIATVENLGVILDEPFGDPSIIPTYLICREARKSVSVCLSGDGGDELFGGYNRYTAGKQMNSLRKSVPQAVAQGSAKVAGKILSLILDCDSSARTGVAKIQRSLSVKNSESLYHELLRSEGWSALTSEIPVSAERSRCTGKNYDFYNKFIESAMDLDQSFYLPCDNLFKVDRASMANSLEVRVPLLNHHIVEFANAQPMGVKIRNGEKKWLLKKTLNRYLNSELFERPKKGFSIPIDTWLRGPLEQFADLHLSNADAIRAAGQCPSRIEKTWQMHLQGKGNFGLILWSVITMVIWMNNRKVYSQKFAGVKYGI